MNSPVYFVPKAAALHRCTESPERSPPRRITTAGFFVIFQDCRESAVIAEDAVPVTVIIVVLTDLLCLCSVFYAAGGDASVIAEI